MIQTDTVSAPPVVAREPRRATRRAQGSYLGGVAGGLADHLGVEVLYVRLFFLVTGVSGFGAVFYAGLWLFVPMEAETPVRSPGLDAATRQGKRPAGRRRLRDAGPAVAVGAVMVGVAALANLAFGGSLLFWPALVAVVGVVVLWRQADEAQRERWLDSSGRVDVRRILLGDGGPGAWTRVVTGVGLLGVALVIFAASSGDAGVARDVVVAGVLGMLGLAITVGPWLLRLTSDLSEERAARIRSQERADVAAHLHDSVLQTLALIQKNSGDAAQVARLARAQERDLRQWMYGEPEHAAASLAAALREAAAEVEDAHAVPVEVVTVGDVPFSEAVQPLVMAAREAMANAARHSGAPKVDVYAEVVPGGSGAAGGPATAVEVFVRDRGRGFDPATVPLDRLGVRGSILGRMERHGGTAEVRSSPRDGSGDVTGQGPGLGTEVRLRMPVEEREP